jgi:rhodanese-related sulfurtransferase
MASTGKVSEVGPSMDLLNQYFIVDVREPEERVETGFVPGSVNIKLSTILDDSAKIEATKPVLFVCRSGARSMKAATHYISRDPSLSCTHITGGTMGWIAAGLPVDHVKQ